MPAVERVVVPELSRPVLHEGAHLASLTSLRFFAAAAVLLLHVGQAMPPFPGARNLLGLGHVGVTFFFVLSGFVLTWTHQEGDSARLFYGRRLARVWPLHLTMTFVAGLLLLNAGASPQWWTLPFVITLTHAFVPGAYYAFNSPSWSLGCEAFFYALFPTLFLFVNRTRRPAIWAVGMCAVSALIPVITVLALAPRIESSVGLSAAGISGYGLNIFPGYRVFEFVTGMLLAIAVRRGWRSAVSLRLAGAALAITWIVLELAGFFILDGASRIQPYWVSIIMLAPLAALVVSAATSDILGRSHLLHNPFLVRLGKASFALYLVHFFVLLEVEHRWPSLPNWVAATFGCAAALILAELAHRFIEAPAEQRLRARIGTRVGRAQES